MKLKQVLGKKVHVLIDSSVTGAELIECILESINYDGIVIAREQVDDFLYEFIPMKRIQSINWNIKKIEEESENENKT